MSRTTRTLLTASLLLALLVPAHAATYYVSTDGTTTGGGSWAAPSKTIQGALARTVRGDQVWVAAGVYLECVTVPAGVKLYGGFAKGDTFAKRNPRTRVTVIDGINRNFHVVRFGQGALPTDTCLDGFTVRNGKDGVGGGVYCNGASPTISNNVIRDNLATDDGAGIGCSYASPVIINNVLAGNRYSGTLSGYRHGGAIYVNAKSSAAAYGPVIAFNVFTDNETGRGGAIDANGQKTVIINNVFARNKAIQGGAIYSEAHFVYIYNNTFVGNTASFTQGGGAVWVHSTDNEVINNIVAGNSQGVCIQGAAERPILRNNCFYNNAQGHTYGYFAETGNFVANPLFRADDALYHILPASPCVEKGLNRALFQGSETDLDGDPRIVDTTMDIGADEVARIRITAGPTVSNLSATGAVISWTTSLPGDSVVAYGYSATLGQRVSSATLAYSHRVTLSGLLAGRTVYYRVRSSNSWYKPCVSTQGTFQTSPGGSVYPVSVTLRPTAVVGGAQSSVGIVTLSGPASTGGQSVTLTSSLTAAAQVPASVVVPQGRTTAWFWVATSAVSSVQRPAIRAACNGKTVSAALTVSPLLSELILVPDSVVGGGTATAVICLAVPAPAGGVTVTLSSSNTAAARPQVSTKTIAAGASVEVVNILTSRVASSTTVSIRVSLGAAQLTQPLVVTP